MKSSPVLTTAVGTNQLSWHRSSHQDAQPICGQCWCPLERVVGRRAMVAVIGAALKHHNPSTPSRIDIGRHLDTKLANVKSKPPQ